MEVTRSRNLKTLLTFAGFVILILAGCKSQKEISAPLEMPESFSGSGSEMIPDRWWSTFNDDDLNAVVDSAMQSNFDLLTAWQRLKAARAVVDRESSALFPAFEAEGSGQVNRYSDSSIDSDQIQLGLATVYEIDLWGRLQSGIDAERFRAQATLFDYQTAALTLAAEIVRTWYRLADAQNQLELIEEQIETNSTVLQLIKNRFEIGQVRGVDVLRQQQLLEATREQKTYAAARVKVLENLLAVLTGNTPQNGIQARPGNLPELSPLPETGIPTDLVRRRPDVQRSYSTLMAADRDLATAISNQFPRLTIRASATTSAANAGSLFENWALSFAGNLLAPIFYGGELRAEVNRNEAVKQQRFFEYGQTILTSFREVEDALVQEKYQERSIDRIERQVELATQSYRQLRIEYLNGSGNYLDVLTALDDIQQLRRNLLSARLTLVEYRIELYRALAGSVETDMMAAE